MLEQSQKLTDGLIIYSVLVSDYEKLDFKNDALAGVRANYFNSGCKEQKEITEIELHGMDYKMSCLLTKNEPFSWKVTRDNLPHENGSFFVSRHLVIHTVKFDFGNFFLLFAA